MAGKKINAYYDSTQKIIIIEDNDVQKGDYIDVSNNSLAEQIFKTQLTKEVKNQVIYEYKDSHEYKEMIDEYVNNINLLNKKNDSLTKDNEIINTKLTEQSKNIETIKENAILNFKNTEYKKLSDECISLKNEISILKNDIKNSKENAINEFKLSDTYKNLEFTIIELENEKKHISDKVIQEFKNSKDYLELEEKANRRTKLNSKVIGEELENFCQNEYNDKFQLSNNTTWEKTTITKQKQKPDFIFKVYSDDKKDVEIGSVVLEMKTAISNQSNNKIDHHISKLEIDRINFNAEFALLVTDLELDIENDFILKKASGNPRIFIVRPQYFTYVLILFKLIYEKSSELTTFLKKGSISKEQILNFINDFKNFKEDLFLKTIKNIKSNLEDISKNANKIKELADKIVESVDTVMGKHLKSVENKLEEYMKKIISKENSFRE